MNVRCGAAVRQGLLASVAVAALSFSSSVARAQAAASSSPSEASRANVRVRVRIVGSLGNDRILRQRIASWFDAQRFAVTVQSVSYLEPRQVLAPERRLQVEAWVTRRSDKLARLYFASPDPDTGKTRYLLRDLALENGLDEVGLESLAEAVHLSTEALLEGQQVSSREQVEQSLQRDSAAPSVARASESAVTSAPAAHNAAAADTAPVGSRDAAAAETAPDAAPPPHVASRSKSSLSFSPAVGYAVALRGDEGVAHGPRASLRVGLPGGWGTLARVQVVVPRRVALGDSRLELYGGAALVAASFRASWGPRVVVEGFVGPSLELVHFSAESAAGAGFAPAAPETEPRPQLVLGAFFGFGSRARIALVPELAFALHGTRYDVARAGQRQAVAHAARLTPSLALELEL